MKIQIDKKILFVLFVILNILLFYFLIKLSLFAARNSIIGINEKTDSAYIPVINKSVEDIRTNSKAFIIYDPTTRVIVAGKNEKLRFAPASTAKIMTSTVVLENYPLDRVLTAKGMDTVDGSKMNLFENETMTVGNLLFGLMLPSGNDAAHVLAGSFPGGVNAFVSKMNEKASILQLTNTRFFDPAGYSDDNYTTAFDMARLAAYAMQNPKFAKIVGTKATSVWDTLGKSEHKLKNLNELLGQNGVTGIKTGFTDEAGGVLVTSINKNDRLYIIVVLNTPDRFGDTRGIINNAIRNLNIVSY